MRAPIVVALVVVTLLGCSKRGSDFGANPLGGREVRTAGGASHLQALEVCEDIAKFLASDPAPVLAVFADRGEREGALEELGLDSVFPEELRARVSSSSLRYHLELSQVFRG